MLLQLAWEAGEPWCRGALMMGLFNYGFGSGLSLVNEGKGRGKYLIQKYPSRKRTGVGMDFLFAGSGLVWSCWPFYSTVEEE